MLWAGPSDATWGSDPSGRVRWSSQNALSYAATTLMHDPPTIDSSSALQVGRGTFRQVAACCARSSVVNLWALLLEMNLLVLHPVADGCMHLYSSRLTVSCANIAFGDWCLVIGN